MVQDPVKLPYAEGYVAVGRVGDRSAVIGQGGRRAFVHGDRATGGRHCDVVCGANVGGLAV